MNLVSPCQLNTFHDSLVLQAAQVVEKGVRASDMWDISSCVQQVMASRLGARSSGVSKQQHQGKEASSS